MAENRKVIDCRRFPGEKPCSIVISGTEDDVLDLRRPARPDRAWPPGHN